MNIKKIQELVEIMNDNGLAEIEIEQEGSKIKISKNVQGVITQQIVPQTSVQAPVASSNAGDGAKAEAAAPNSNCTEVKSPMVGTFYASPSPESPAYVQKGDMISVGDVICIVEAMKVMNEVKSECAGKIVDILASNADPVEFGQVMFLVEPM
jgi:acetyl-CoA carboxylase biotin carboxyl carrier protein